MVQFLPFWDDVTISFLAFSLLKQQEQKKNGIRLFIIDYLWLFYALVNLTFFYFSLISYYIDYNRKLSKQLSTKLKFDSYF
jgi:hypothetical protein